MPHTTSPGGDHFLKLRFTKFLSITSLFFLKCFLNVSLSFKKYLLCKLELLIFMLVLVDISDHLMDNKPANKFLSFYLHFQFHRIIFFELIRT